MYMPEELPYIPISATITEERIVVQVNTALSYFNLHLYRHFLKPVHISLTYILSVMITHDQTNLAIQPIEYFCPFGRTSLNGR